MSDAELTLSTEQMTDATTGTDTTPVTSSIGRSAETTVFPNARKWFHDSGVRRLLLEDTRAIKNWGIAGSTAVASVTSYKHARPRRG